MNLKKNAVSYIAWMIILLFTGTGFAFIGMVLAQTYHLNLILAAIGCIFVFFGILYMVYSMTGYVTSLKSPKSLFPHLKKKSRIWERIGVVVLLLGGLLMRIMFLSIAGESAAYYEVTKIADQNANLIQSVQGSVYYYCVLLHAFFRMAGNHWIAGIYLQITLQLISSLLFYFFVRRMISRSAALVVLVYHMFSPYCVKEGLTYSPNILYFFIFTFVSLLFSDFIKKSISKEKFPTAMWFYGGLVGCFIGICAYVDVTGWMILLFSYYLFVAAERKSDFKQAAGRLLLILAGAVVSFLMMLFLDACISRAPFIRVLNAWFITYSSYETTFGILENGAIHDIAILLVLISLGVFSFWRRKDTERFSPFVFVGLILTVLHICGITTQNMDGSYLLCLILSTIMSVGITELFCEPETSVQKSAAREEEVNGLEEQGNREQVRNEQEQVRFIESPLPLPKKKPKQVMDYAYIPKEKEMMYDLLVSDSDDYDIKE